ncbi:hypothetical protein EPYR_00683 [Erwinia pyrifoliae DSM 12163]|nr:hypothetical protein EPYR_00683 [Erwinia pyrifoliae DSM 12163]
MPMGYVNGRWRGGLFKVKSRKDLGIASGSILFI